MSTDVPADVLRNLDGALTVAAAAFVLGAEPAVVLTGRMRESLEQLNLKAQQASGAFNNIITCLAIKTALPEADVRFHQSQIQHLTDRPAGVNFRRISETVVYPWLSRERFEGAKSGWQTRTLERPKPYKMNYDENIAHVKGDFLTVFDELEENNHPAVDALTYLLYMQVKRREEVKMTLSVPKTQDINLIVEMLKMHFFGKYGGARGASRLPVLALHAIYSSMVPELRRYIGKSVLPLQHHSAADAQTGSLGDIEVVDDISGHIFEAVEVKHGIQINEAIAADVQTKVMDKEISRYYILTTHENCEPDDGAKAIIRNIKSVYDCQVIANGVLATLRYYLRLLDDPSVFFPAYINLIQTDGALSHEHRLAWNEVVKRVVA